MPVIISLITSCSSSGKLSVKSNPSEAIVKLYEQSGDIKEMGKTPISIDLDEVFSNSKNIKLIVEKQDFEAEKIILTKPSIQTNYDVSVSLIRDTASASEQENQKKYQIVATRIAEAYEKIQQKNLRAAEGILIRFLDEFPNVSVGYDLLGNVYFIMGDKNAALSQYTKADELNPNNFERKRIIEKLKRSR
jgi:tetratricopeptide (TPR) repeat protein